jgi:hypothetical protein
MQTGLACRKWVQVVRALAFPEALLVLVLVLRVLFR